MALNRFVVDDVSEQRSDVIELEVGSADAYCNLRIGDILGDNTYEEVRPSTGENTFPLKANSKDKESELSIRMIVVAAVCVFVLSAVTSTIVIVVYHKTIAKAENSEKFQELQSQLDILVEKHNISNAQLDELHEASSHQYGILENTSHQLDLLENTQENTSHHLDVMVKTHENRSQRLDALEKTQENQIQRLDVLEGAHENTSHHLDVLEKAQEDTSHHLDVLEKAQEDTNHHVDVLEKAQEDTNHHIDVLEKIQDNTSQNIEVLEKAQDNTSHHVDELEKTNENRSQRLDVLEKALENTSQNLNVLEKTQENTSHHLDIIEKAHTRTSHEFQIMEQTQGNMSMFMKTLEEQQLATIKEIEIFGEKLNGSEKKVAFSVYEPYPSLWNGVTPTFSTVLLNTGSYAAGTGRFTCPVAGIYSFSFSLQHNSSIRKATDCWFRVNGVKKSYVTVFEDAYEQASGTMLVELSVGNVVDLYCVNWDYVMHYHISTTFSGVLITPA